MTSRVVLIFGAGSGIAKQLAETSRERGVTAVGVTRSRRAGSETADVNDVAAARRVFAAHPDATTVVSIVGGRPFMKEAPPDLDGNRNLIETAKARGVRRFVLVSTIGAGDSRAAAPLAARQPDALCCAKTRRSPAR